MGGWAGCRRPEADGAVSAGAQPGGDSVCGGAGEEPRDLELWASRP